jgi:hypothetical protein
LILDRFSTLDFDIAFTTFLGYLSIPATEKTKLAIEKHKSGLRTDGVAKFFVLISVITGLYNYSFPTSIAT